MKDDRPFAQIYVACALTSVSETSRRILKKDCTSIVDTIHHVAGDTEWRVVAYDPISRTPPWEKYGEVFSAEDVWKIDTAKVLEEADAVIIHGFQGGSAGVGIELAFAFNRGIPILYLHHETAAVSRMVQGMPGFIEVAAFLDFGDDERDELRRIVAEWLRTWRGVIEDGPATRASMATIFRPVQQALSVRWLELDETTRAAAAFTARMTTREAAEYLGGSMRLASMPSAKLLLLGAALGVNVLGLLAPRWRPAPLEANELEALRAAAREYEWGDAYTHYIESMARAFKERMKRSARSERLVARDDIHYDLTNPADWVRFLDDWKRGTLS